MAHPLTQQLDYEDIIEGKQEDKHPLPFNKNEFVKNNEIYHTVNTPGWKFIMDMLQEKLDQLSNDSTDSEETGEKLVRVQAKAKAGKEIKNHLINEIAAAVNSRL